MSPSLLKNKKILILGSSGFLGRKLVDTLLGKNAQLKTYTRNVNVNDYKSQNIIAIQGDFIQGINLNEALNDIDIVYHLIGNTIPGTSNLDLIGDIESNVLASIRLLEKIKVSSIKKLIFISSGGAIYGNPLVLPTTENHPLCPISSYGIVKSTIEKYIYMFSNLYGLNATVLRLSNVYGPQQLKFGFQGFISTCFQKIANDEPIEIWGDGSVVRDYIYIEDAVDAMLKALEDIGTDTYNIGSGIGYSLQEVFTLVSNIMGKKGQITYLPKRIVDVDKIYLDITKAKSKLNWQPKFSLEEGCRHFWEMRNER